MEEKEKGEEQKEAEEEEVGGKEEGKEEEKEEKERLSRQCRYALVILALGRWQKQADS